MTAGKRRIELISPAKNLACGIEAVNHGADAVYIGASNFGARAAAGNSLEDITTLITYAHLYHVRVYVTMNTILRDDELCEAEDLIWKLYHAGADALIIQDPGITRLHLPCISLHVSTQADNRTPEKVEFWASAGFRQVVLARELSLADIEKTHKACPSVSLEVFVHGALCTCYSGQCYAGQAYSKRSANRGECPQFCRLPFDLVDSEGRMVMENKHLLSLKDLNLSDELEKLMDAGVSSFKIEGRLKDVSYVKNITAFYRRKLDAIFMRRQEYIGASSGVCRFFFTPQPDKSFNRGFTDYFLYGRPENSQSVDTPKSLGEKMGTVKKIQDKCLIVASEKSFHNGDGICYLDEKEQLQGFRVNRAEGNKLYPHEMPEITQGAILYRNYDQEFEHVLSRKSAERKVIVSIILAENNFGFSLTYADKNGNSVTLSLPYEKVRARIPQTESLKVQLGKLGDTPFMVGRIDINFTEDWFIPVSALTAFRRRTVEKLIAARRITFRQETNVMKPTFHPFSQKALTYLGNIYNSQAVSFYRDHGVADISPAYEQKPPEDATLMFCKHCLRYSMGVCPTLQKGISPYKEPFYLRTTNGKRFRLFFDCKNCVMQVMAH
ncbi:putative protease YdcP [termite gut metagenome]|uniref:Putative protease YdcP n=1 Tax=termite gut metagenome TaxID=433724 RepID=A0A5J4SKW8_9ZZZZ